MLLTVSMIKMLSFNMSLKEVKQEMFEMINWSKLFQTASAACQNALSTIRVQPVLAVGICSHCIEGGVMEYETL